MSQCNTELKSAATRPPHKAGPQATAAGKENKPTIQWVSHIYPEGEEILNWPQKSSLICIKLMKAVVSHMSCGRPWLFSMWSVGLRPLPCAFCLQGCCARVCRGRDGRCLPSSGVVLSFPSLFLLPCRLQSLAPVTEEEFLGLASYLRQIPLGRLNEAIQEINTALHQRQNGGCDVSGDMAGWNLFLGNGV